MNRKPATVRQRLAFETGSGRRGIPTRGCCLLCSSRLRETMERETSRRRGTRQDREQREVPASSRMHRARDSFDPVTAGRVPSSVVSQGPFGNGRVPRGRSSSAAKRSLGMTAMRSPSSKLCFLQQIPHKRLSRGSKIRWPEDAGSLLFETNSKRRIHSIEGSKSCNARIIHLGRVVGERATEKWWEG